jgi:hypothetical protein
MPFRGSSEEAIIGDDHLELTSGNRLVLKERYELAKKRRPLRTGTITLARSCSARAHAM